ncbi:MAG TPA: hypothetical protein VNK26_07755 [Pyrinomonadaceae bacterium]|nr:hypothetical protein [Pyrinomonadaceae bacterium]
MILSILGFIAGLAVSAVSVASHFLSEGRIGWSVSFIYLSIGIALMIASAIIFRKFAKKLSAKP